MNKKAVCLFVIFAMLSLCVCNAFADDVAVLYSPEGDTLTVHSHEVEAYVALGWYTYPVVRMYSETGDSIVVDAASSAEYESVGWHTDKTEVQTTLYAPGGKECTVFNYYVEDYIKLGWSREKIPLVYYDGFYIFDYGAFAAAECLSESTYEGQFSYLYRLGDYESVANYIQCLCNDGWIIYYENNGVNEWETYFVDKANTMMICVMVNKTYPGYVSVTFRQ
ncbi:MAG: hypothetical protein IJ297_03635 [Clostridia bacterium]|nr:hypothetical protein [Clostridia bacterium]